MNITGAATVQMIGIVDWDKTMAEYLHKGWELEHFSTALSPTQGVIYSGVFIKRGA